MSLIPDALLEQIQQRSDIVELVSGYVSLKRAGRNFKGLCPFHQEKTPSFMVSPDKQIFHCFGCGVGGNVFNFLMRLERLEFPEAVECLAEKAGIDITRKDKEDNALHDRTKRVLRANELALGFYELSLKKADDSSTIQNYIRQRHLNPETLQHLKIGYAPAEWDGLLKYAEGKISPEELEQAGLVITKQGGDYYDRFRHRMIFPIFSAKGECVAFGARVLDDSLPKYINSPETPVYRKGHHLYGLYGASSEIRKRDEVIVVEGYMDLASLIQQGIGHAVAVLGTALTDDQIRLIKRYTHNVVMLYDSDQAGEMATLRSLDLSVSAGLSVRIVRLPEDHDPDSFAVEFGREKLMQEIQAAKTLFDYKFDLLKKQHSDKTVEGKTKIAAEMLSTIARIENEVYKTSLAKELADRLTLNEEAVLTELKRVKTDSVRTSAVLGQRSTGLTSAIFSKGQVHGVPLTERLLIGLSLESEDFLKRVISELDENDFVNPSTRRLFRLLVDFCEKAQPVTPTRLMNLLESDNQTQAILSSICVETDSVLDKDKTLKDSINNMKVRRLDEELKHLKEEIQSTQGKKDESRLNQLLYEYSSKEREKRSFSIENSKLRT